MAGYIPRRFIRRQTVTHPVTNRTMYGLESNSRPVDHESDALTITLPSDPLSYCAAVKNFSVSNDDDTAFPVQRDHVTRLSPYTNYTFVVRAGNRVNDVIEWGDWSDSMSVVTDTARKLDLSHVSCLFHLFLLY